MKHLTLLVPDDMEALIKNLVAHMPEVEIVADDEEPFDDGGLDDIDRRVAMAMNVLQQNGALRNPYDYTWIMVAIGDGMVDGLGAFRSPQSYMNYLQRIGIEHVPSRSTISAWYNKVIGKYPDWEFTDTKDPTETLRRKNVFKQFQSAMNRTRRGVVGQ